MHPAILEGDALLVNTLPYYIRTPDKIPFTGIRIPSLELSGLGSLERGDVVVFTATKQRRSYSGINKLVKRCVGLPGDIVQLQNGIVTINGHIPNTSGSIVPMEQERIYRLFRKNRQVIVPYRGYEILLDSTSAATWQEVIEAEGTQITYRNNIVFLNGRPATFYRFQQDYFFAVGDNTGDSYDSRHFGFIPHKNLIGQVFVVYWSRDPDEGIRWGRIGTWVN